MLYKAYGKVICSDIEFPQLVVEEGKEPQLYVKIGEIPSDIKEYINTHKGPGGKGDGRTIRRNAIIHFRIWLIVTLLQYGYDGSTLQRY